MTRRIIAFRQDEDSQWIGDLDCGHSLHFRHNPPWMDRLWVTTEAGRARFIGHEMECTQCSETAAQL